MENKETILEKALGLFAARGYDAVGVQEICEEAHVTKPTLYHYFGSKRGLLDAILEEYFARLNRVLDPALDYQRDIVHTLEMTSAAIFRFAMAYPDFYRLQLALWFAPPESESFQAVERLNRAVYERLADMFRQASQDHGNMKGRQAAYAATFMGMINTYIGMALNAHVELDDRLNYQAVHQFMHGIFS